MRACSFVIDANSENLCAVSVKHQLRPNVSRTFHTHAITGIETADETAAALSDDARRLYDKHLSGFKKSIPVSQKMAGPPEKVAAAVEEALTARRPRARYVVGFVPKVQLRLLTGLPTGVRDRVLRAVSKQPG